MAHAACNAGADPGGTAVRFLHRAVLNPCVADRAQVPAVSTAAAAQDIERLRWHAQPVVALAQVCWVTDVQLGRNIQLGVAARRRVRTNALVRVVQVPPLAKHASKWLGWAQFTATAAGSNSAVEALGAIYRSEEPPGKGEG